MGAARGIDLDHEGDIAAAQGDAFHHVEADDAAAALIVDHGVESREDIAVSERGHLEKPL
jgi:hypothetical protein